MVQWNAIYSLATLFAIGRVLGLPIEEDVCETNATLVVMDETFPGIGGYRNPELIPTAASPNTADTTQYAPGELHTPVRRLEATLSTDMKKIETFFGMKLVTDITKLPVEYKQNPSPWSSSYWPTYIDSINYRWDKKQPSAAEKYATAFGYDVKTLMDKISALKGVDSMKHHAKCSHNSECKKLKDNSVCAKREGRTTGYCIPKWYGICHAWAPASIMEAEPVCQVERNGTVFEPYDIKALVTLAYDGANISTVFMGTRCNGVDKAANKTDKYGRYLDAFRRDISPGLFHIAMTNIMGRFNRTFIIDIAADSSVWNQPVSSYLIVSLLWMTPAKAAMKYFNTTKYPFNDAATKIAVVTTRFSWVIEGDAHTPPASSGHVPTVSADYEYILETDDTYEILGGEWIGRSKWNHPDFIWMPASKPDLSTVTRVGLVYSEIADLVAESSGDCKPLGSKTPKSSESLSTNITFSVLRDASPNAPTAVDNSMDSSERTSTAPETPSPDAEISTSAAEPSPAGSETPPLGPAAETPLAQVIS